MKLKVTCSHSYDQPRQHIKKKKDYFAYKGPSSQIYGVSSSHVWMWDLDYKESWAPKNWCFWTVVLEKSHESYLACKEFKADNPQENQSWIFIRRMDAETETPDVNNPLEKTLMLEKFEGRKRRGWDGWMGSPTQWTWVWANFGCWWSTGKPGMLHPMGSQRIGHD